MENFRSNSCREGRMQMEIYYADRAAPTNIQDLRSYSVNTASASQPNQIVKIKKGKSNFGSVNSKSWSFNDPELQRKKRVAGYKAYTVEGKMKGSLRKSFRWIKNTYSQVSNGWW